MIYPRISIAIQTVCQHPGPLLQHSQLWWLQALQLLKAPETACEAQRKRRQNFSEHYLDVYWGASGEYWNPVMPISAVMLGNQT